MKSVLLQQVYAGSEHKRLIDAFYSRHAEYCAKRDIDYQVTYGNVLDLPAENGGWAKVELIRRALKYYDFVMWLDADAFIRNLNNDIREAPVEEGRFGVVKLQGPRFPHWNVGVMYIRRGNGTGAFMDLWLQSQNWQTDIWHEQTSFNQIAEEQGDIVSELPAVWSANFSNNWVENAHVNHYPGIRDINFRLQLMREHAECPVH